jgi:glycosyltransferase involved in cell wall biosynthesis
MPHVLHVAKYYDEKFGGGIETYTRILARGTAGQYNSTVVASSRNNTLSRRLDGAVDVWRIPNFTPVRPIPVSPSLPSLIQRMPRGIIHIQSPNPIAEMLLLASNLINSNTVITYHNDSERFARMNGPYLRLWRRVVERAGRVITVYPESQHRSTFLQEAKQKLTFIPMGIDLTQFGSQGDAARGATFRAVRPSPLLLCVGRLVPYKGHEILLRALALTAGHLVIIGSGPLEVALRRLSEELGIDRRVEFLGHVSQRDLVAWYYASDFLILPSVSRAEVYGLVQLEAFACGRPVISTAIEGSGVSYVNHHGVSGLVVPPGDVGELTAAISRLSVDAQLRSRLGAGAKARVEREFSADTMVERTLGVYRTTAAW